MGLYLVYIYRATREVTNIVVEVQYSSDVSSVTLYMPPDKKLIEVANCYIRGILMRHIW